MMIPYRAILNDREYQEYRQDYETRIMKDKSCKILKKEILGGK